MGMNQAIAKECITTNCRAVVIHAGEWQSLIIVHDNILLSLNWSFDLIATRRNTHKAVVSFEPITSLKPNELWKVGKDKKSQPQGKSKKAKRMRLNTDDEEESDSFQSQSMDMWKPTKGPRNP